MTSAIKSFVAECRAYLNDMPRKGIHHDLKLALAMLEKYEAAIEKIANPIYCDHCDKGYEFAPCICFESPGGTDVAIDCQKEVTDLLSGKGK